jgi:hypothetical protein
MGRLTPLVFALLSSPFACETREVPMPDGPGAGPGRLANVVPMPSNPDSAPFTEPGLEVSLVPGGAFRAEGPAVVTFRLTNTGPEAKRVCTVFTPLEGRDRLTLEVHDAAGARLPLARPKEPGPKPQPEDFVELAPGETLERPLDLRRDFALPPGRYTVRFRGAGLVNHLPDSPPLTLEIPSE